MDKKLKLIKQQLTDNNKKSTLTRGQIDYLLSIAGTAYATNYMDNVAYELTIDVTEDDDYTTQKILIRWDLTDDYQSSQDNHDELINSDDYNGYSEYEDYLADEYNACDWDNPAVIKLI